MRERNEQAVQNEHALLGTVISQGLSVIKIIMISFVLFYLSLMRACSLVQVET